MKDSLKVIVVMLLAAVLIATGLMMNLTTGQHTMELRIAYSNKVDYEPLILADHFDLYEEAGIDTSSLIVTGGIQAAEALATGSVDVAAMGGAPAILLVSQNPGMRIIARYGGGEGMHRIIALNDIQEAKDMNGKRIGVQQGSSSHGALLAWANVNGLDMSSVTLVAISPTDMPEAMATRQIDAMAGSEPWPTNVETMCGDQVHEIGNSSSLGNTFPLVLVINERVINERSDMLDGMMVVIEQAIRILESDRGYAAEVCSKYTGISVGAQLSCMSHLFYELGFDDTDVESLNLTSDFLVMHQRIDSAPNPHTYLDLRFLQGKEERVWMSAMVSRERVE